MNKKHNFLEEKKTNCEYTVFPNAFLTFTTIVMIMNTYKLYKYLLMHSVLRLKKGAISNLCFDDSFEVIVKLSFLRILEYYVMFFS